MEADDALEGWSVSMPAPLDDRALGELFYLQSEEVEEYAGWYSMSLTCADHLIAIKAKKGRSRQVEAALKRRREDVLSYFEESLPEQYEKAKAGKIVRLGDYCFLIMAGGSGQARQQTEAAWETIRSGFSS